MSSVTIRYAPHRTELQVVASAKEMIELCLVTYNIGGPGERVQATLKAADWVRVLTQYVDQETRPAPPGTPGTAADEIVDPGASEEVAR